MAQSASGDFSCLQVGSTTDSNIRVKKSRALRNIRVEKCEDAPNIRGNFVTLRCE